MNILELKNLMGGFKSRLHTVEWQELALESQYPPVKKNKCSS